MSAWSNIFDKHWAQNTYNHYAGKSAAQTALEPHVAALGVIYRAQMPFPAFQIVADFGIPSLGLLIECDGKEHRQKKKRESDVERDAKLLKAGWITIRIQNEEVLDDPEAAMKKILARYEEEKRKL